MSEAQTRRWWWNALYLLAALIVLYTFTHWFNLFFRIRAYPPYTVRPYVSRALMPYTAQMLDEATPQAVKDAVMAVLNGPGLVLEFGERFSPTFFMFLMYLLSGIGFLVFGHAIKATYQHYYGQKYAPIAGVLALLSIPLTYRYFNHAYDPGTLALAAATLLFSAKRQRFFFIVAYLLWCVHRETAIAAVAVYMVAWWKHQPKWLTLVEGGVLAAAYWGLQTRVNDFFSPFPGSKKEDHLLDHQAKLLTDFLVPFVFSLMFYALIVYLIRDRWRDKPNVPKAGLVFFGLPLFVLSIFHGYVDEIRALYDLYPHALALALPSLMARLGLAEENWRQTDALEAQAAAPA